MKNPLLSTTLILFMCTLVVIAAAASPQSSTTTQRLTDRTLAVYDAFTPQIVFTSSSLHVIWPEYTTYSSPGPVETDLFYAQLPGSTTERLYDSYATGLGVIFEYQIMADSNGQIYTAWIEPTVTEGSDVYFWKTGMTTPQNISDHTQSEGDAGTLFLTLDNNYVPHILWAEKIGTNQRGIFYWQEGGTTTKLSTGVPTLSANNVGVESVISQNNIIHALWIDHNPVSGRSTYYWNTATQVAINLREGEPEGSLINNTTASLQPDGTFHAVWQEEMLATPSQYVHWDSATQTRQVIISNYPPTTDFKTATDSNGDIHAIYQIDQAIKHWDSESLSYTQLTASATTSRVPYITNGKADNKVHVVWWQTSTVWPTHLNDLFYWEPGIQAKNISDHSQPPADVPIPGYVHLEAVTDGSVHVAWEEGMPTYYHSGTDTTTTLNNSVTVSYNTDMAFETQPDTPYMGRQGKIFEVYDDVAYWFLASTSSNTPYPYYLWRSDTNSYTAIPAVYGTDNPMFHGHRFMWFDRFGQAQLVWRTEVPGEYTNIHYWNSTDGSVDITDSQNTLADVFSAMGATDLVGNVYVIWLEDDNTLYQNSFDRDVYAAIKQVELSYLPLLQR